MSSPTLDRINQDLKEAMKAKQKERLAAIRMIRGTLKNLEIDKRRELEEQDVIDALSTELKKRRESANLYQEAGRPELAEKEEFEIEIIQSYLPEQLSEDEVLAIIDEIISSTGATSKSDLGKVMGAMMGKIKGRFDGGRAKDLVMSRLS